MKPVLHGDLPILVPPFNWEELNIPNEEEEL
jgi:hypothetical protein